MSDAPTADATPSITQTRVQAQPRAQPRARGRFASDPDAPGTSTSSRYRRRRQKVRESDEACRGNVRELFWALCCLATKEDYIPASAADGPLLGIILALLRPEYCVATRHIFGICKDEYFRRFKKRSLSRWKLKKNGVVVLKRAYVFSGVRLPQMDNADSLVALKRLLGKWKRDEKLVGATVAGAIDRIKPLLNTYDGATFEYEGYPRTNPSPASVPTTAVNDQTQSIVAPSNQLAQAAASLSVNLLTDDHLFVSRVNEMAAKDSEYILLKTVLAEDNMVVFKAAAMKWRGVLVSMREGGRLTALEQAIVDYARFESSEHRAEVERGLERLLFCLMQLRKVDGKDLFLHKGYNPPEFADMAEE